MRYCNQRTITDAAFAHLRGVHTLNIRECHRITDAALSHVSGIRTLNINGCRQLTDAAFDALALNAPRLRSLTTAGLNRISDGALIALGAKTRLE